MSRLMAALCISLVLALAGCGGAAETPTAVSTPVAKSTNTAEVRPTATARTRAETTPTNLLPPMPTNTTEAKPTQTPTEEVSQFEIGEPVIYTPQYLKNLVVAGVIKYKGTVVRKQPDITVTLTDEAGNVLATGKSYIAPSIVKPNSNIPYSVSLDNPPEDWEKWEVQVQAQAMDSFSEAFSYGDLEVSQENLVKPKADYENLKLVGKVKNTGTKTASLIQVLAVAYDADGKVLDVGFTFSSIDKLAPGQDSPFSIDFLHAKDAEKYEVISTASISQ